MADSFIYNDQMSTEAGKLQLQYAEEAQTWDAMKKHMYVIAMCFAGLIIKEFADKLS